MSKIIKRGVALIAFGASAAVMAPGAAAKDFGPWSEPVNVATLAGSSDQINTPANDGCPILSPYDDSLYIASNRPGSLGMNDIYRAPRSGDGWGTPVSVGTPVNGAANDFCPTPTRGNRLFFVSTRGNSDPTNGDVYVAKMGPKGTTISKLGPNINTAAPEWSPSWFEDEDGNEVLYFSRQNGADHDIYYSVNNGPASLAQGGVNGPTSNDARPNVRHDGLEIVWDSIRAGTRGTDVFTASRSSTSEPWGAARAIDIVNSAAGESRASLSWDGTILMFGTTRESGTSASDVYMAVRSKITDRR